MDICRCCWTIQGHNTPHSTARMKLKQFLYLLVVRSLHEACHQTPKRGVRMCHIRMQSHFSMRFYSFRFWWNWAFCWRLKTVPGDKHNSPDRRCAFEFIIIATIELQSDDIRHLITSSFRLNPYPKYTTRNAAKKKKKTKNKNGTNKLWLY